jgi:HlyD family secretion protein
MKDFFAKMSRRTKIIVAAVAAVVIVVVWVLTAGLRVGPATEFQTATIEKGTLTATVGATGNVHARQSATLTWQTTGSVEAVNVTLGDRVHDGDVLAALDQPSLPQNVIAAEADFVSAQQALDDLRSSDTARAQALIDLKNAQEAYDKALEYRKSLNGKIDLQRVTFISIGGQQVPQIKYYKGYADATTIANADDDLALKKAQLEDAQRVYDRIKDGPNAADIAAAEAKVAAAQATLNTARIVAPFAGTVTQAESLPGDQVSAGDMAFRLDDLTSLLVDVEVSEVDINSVGVGQPVTLSFDAILGQEYNGKVVQVAQAGNLVDGVVSFAITVEITDADEMVKPGMTAAVNIVVNELTDVLLVPNRAVRVVDGQRVVYILKDDEPVQVDIRLGSSSDTMSVVVGGDLKVGDTVILNPPVQFQPGGEPGGGGGF